MTKRNDDDVYRKLSGCSGRYQRLVYTVARALVSSGEITHRQASSGCGVQYARSFNHDDGEQVRPITRQYLNSADNTYSRRRERHAGTLNPPKSASAWKSP